MCKNAFRFFFRLHLFFLVELLPVLSPLHLLLLHLLVKAAKSVACKGICEGDIQWQVKGVTKYFNLLHERLP